MSAGGKRSTSWEKGGNIPVKAKGTKNKLTVLKESFGVKNWTQLQDFVEKKGLQKLIKEMETLSGHSYSSIYLQLCEFIKPKLQRTTITGDPESPIIWREEKIYAIKPQTDNSP